MYLGNSRILLGEGNQKGNLYIGGIFTSIGGNTVNRIAKWNGSEWQQVGTGIDNEYVATPIIRYKGNLLVGGAFTTIGGATVNRIAKWNGSSFSEFEGGANGGVFDIIKDPNGNLYVGGTFTTIGGITANRISKWNGSSWSSLSGGVSNGGVSRLYYHEGTVGGGGPGGVGSYELYVGGSFTNVDGIAANRIAKWDGSSWSSLGDGFITFNTGCNGIIVYQDELYACGNFLSPHLRISKWNGSTWSGLSSGLNSIAYDMVIFRGELVVAGGFTTAGGGDAKLIAKWNGTSWSSLGSGLGGSSTPTILRYAYRLLVYNNKLYVFGKGLGSTISDNRVKVWDGNSWSDFGDSPNDGIFGVGLA